MSVYVGVPMWPYRNMIMCHMVADSEDELDNFAFVLGLKPEWKQIPKRQTGIGSLVHYDISKGMRNEAIKLGAIPLDDLHSEVEVFYDIAWPEKPRKKKPKKKEKQ